MENKQGFWIDRFKNFGHTGWSSPVIYAYDQVERLAIVSKKIEQLNLAPCFALDYGCGMGDFSRMLLDKGCSVLGYDPFVKPTINHPKFKYSSENKAIGNSDSKFGLILTVTVLDHILEDENIKKELILMRERIAENGIFIMLEYALDEKRDSVDQNEYQAFRKLTSWQFLLQNSGWEIVSEEPVPHVQVLFFDKAVVSYTMEELDDCAWEVISEGR